MLPVHSDSIQVAILSKVMIIHKLLEVYFGDWIVFGIVKCHVAILHLMLDTFHRYQISLNLKKFIFCVPYGILLGHVVRKQGLTVDLENIVVIFNLEAQNNVKQLRTMLTHTRYHGKFIEAYA